MNVKTYLQFLSRNKVYTLVSIVGYAIGLMFVIVLSLYVKDELSVDDFHSKKDRIFLFSADGIFLSSNEAPVYLKSQYPEIEEYCRAYNRTVSVKLGGSSVGTEKTLIVDDTFFDIFDFKLVMGNPNQVLKNKNSVVLSDIYAKQLFGNKNPLGLSVFVDGIELTVMGIMKPFPNNTIFAPVNMLISYDISENYFQDSNGLSFLHSWSNSSFSAFYLLKEGADLNDKKDQIIRQFQDIWWLFRDKYVKSLEFVPLRDVYFMKREKGANFLQIQFNNKSQLTIYSAIALLILIISTLNYVNLTIAQAGFRSKEAAIRKLLGSSKRDIFIQFIEESLGLMIVSFLLSILFVYLAIPYFNDVLDTKLVLGEQLSVGVVAVAMLGILFISILAGFLPAKAISKINAVEVLKGTLKKKIKSKYFKIFIVFQFVLSMVLLMSTFFMTKQFNYMTHAHLGYDYDRLFEMPGISKNQMQGLYERLKNIPGVEEVTFTGGSPVDMGNNMSQKVDGEPISFQHFTVDSLFFKTFGIKIKPTFYAHSGSRFKMYLNQEAMRVIKPEERNGVWSFWGEDFTIMGEVIGLKYNSLRKAEDSPLMITVGEHFNGVWNTFVRIEEHANLAQVQKKLKEVYEEFIDHQDIITVSYVPDILRNRYHKEEKSQKMMKGFAMFTLVVMVMGVFAISLYMMKEKRKEIGIRRVSGATEKEILFMLIKQTLKQLGIAFLVATPIVYYVMTHWLESYAYHIELSWYVFIGAALIVTLLAMLSVIYQTLQVVRANPIDAIHREY